MAYSRKTWVDRESEYPTRRILTNTSSGTEQQVTVTRDEGTVSVAGDSFDAQTMNNFEGRIASEFTNQGSAIGTLSNLTTDVKTDLVSAINEVKSDIPVIPTIPQDLDDLGDVNKPAGGVLDGSVPCWDVTHSEYDIRQPDASEITYDSTTSQPNGTVGDAVQDLQSDMTNQIARIDALYDEKADLESPALTGNPTAPTQTAGNNSTRIATTAFVQGAKPSVGSITNLTTVSANTSSWQNVGSVATAKGSKYLIVITSEFAGNSTGVRQIGISTTSGGSPIDFFRAVGANNMGTVKQQLQLVSILAPSSNTTYYINVAQNSGSGLEIKGKYSLIKLA